MDSSSSTLFSRALQVIPGGVNSPVRAFGSVGGTPKFIKKAQGAFIWDTDGQQYIDYVGSWGPAIVGHAHPKVVEAIQHAASQGCSYGAPTEAEVVFAERLCSIVPSMEQVRLVSSGTEATMTAIRLARGATGRTFILKFEGCYHGHSDALLVKAGSGLLTFSQPSSSGVPEDYTQYTLVIPYNDIPALEVLFHKKGHELAGVIVEPYAGNMNFIRPNQKWIQRLRELCTQYQSILIFDEVMTGFRVALGGAQSVLGITPDLTTLGKVIGGGLPLAAVGGLASIMSHLSPTGQVYQAGTLSGNPLAVAAGLATLDLIQEPNFYTKLADNTRLWSHGLNQLAEKVGLPLSSDCEGGMFGVYTTSDVPCSYQEIMACDVNLFKNIFHAALSHGIYLAPSAFEAGFVSIAHHPDIIKESLHRMECALISCRGILE
jgi:glutamate-1-semialdehyde 2,1-aminomutase